MSNGHYSIENGLLTFKPFVGPLQQIVIAPKHSIAKTLEQYDNVAESTLIVNNLKEQQAAIALAGDAAEIKTMKETDRFKKKVIRRRKKFVYHAADEVLKKDYWHRERRSLTKFHSNSLMYEYKMVQGFDGDKTKFK